MVDVQGMEVGRSLPALVRLAVLLLHAVQPGGADERLTRGLVLAQIEFDLSQQLLRSAVADHRRAHDWIGDQCLDLFASPVGSAFEQGELGLGLAKLEHVEGITDQP